MVVCDRNADCGSCDHHRVARVWAGLFSCSVRHSDFLVLQVCLSLQSLCFPFVLYLTIPRRSETPIRSTTGILGRAATVLFGLWFI